MKKGGNDDGMTEIIPLQLQRFFSLFLVFQVHIF
jgi:hypothetical protein